MVEIPQPPPRPITPPHPHHHGKPADFLFAALSIFFLFSSSSSPPSSSKTLKIPFFSCPLKPRRFLKIFTMSNPSPKPRRHTHRHFANPQSLSDWLKPRLPSDSFASWGVKPGTKNVHNLWLELSEGETSLADSTPPVRTVNVVTVRIIGKDGSTLVESRQELSDGSVRDRCRPLSEKMKPDETPEEAVFRAVKEELGSIIPSPAEEIVRIVPGSYKKNVEERNSASYPGLPARYILHSVDAIVEGLPEDQFCTEEAEEYEHCDEIGMGIADQAVSVKRHHWKWVNAES
ncbi:uncharacterized protein LOC116205054 [Punica granatum]|uniref:Nudix hydrolase domain-containing protein n=2 Tax=Punica granatum TaxID=22663 RepID=A0A218X429_PUNGR|nr:uncharacterized protein LOC116205054 [Punica granatum]OWM79684.1 hypothetical protein CDL15_Pgr023096 [Punica granatum]PKI53917.1 hypothetical protein CRG98_025711 [Punica granatum]